MKQPPSKTMTEVTRLTRSGDLSGATALIRSMLAAAPAGDAVEGAITGLDGAPAAPARQPLAETLRWITSGGMPPPAQGQAQVAPAVDGARFTLHSHRGPEGTRDYWLYRPACAAGSGTALPLVVMLHGCTQSPEDFAAGTGMNALAEEFGALIAYPAQPQAANMQRCWNWYNPGDQGRDRGAPAVIAGLTRDILQAEAVDPTRVYIAGLSAGGAAATLVARAYPDVFAAAGVHSGLPAGAARDVASAFAAMRNGAAGQQKAQPMPTIVFHGNADSTVHPSNGTAVVSQSLAGFPALTAQVTTGKAKGGRAYRRTRHVQADGRTMIEHWSMDGGGHAWSGGHPSGSFTDPTGPEASREFLRFFLQHSTPPQP